MVNQNIILSGLTRKELQEDIVRAITNLFKKGIDTDIFGKCINGTFSSIEETSRKEFKAEFGKGNEVFLTRNEVARLLKISLPTLHRYTKDGILKSYRIGNKVRYKQSEVENALNERNFGLPKKGGVK